MKEVGMGDLMTHALDAPIANVLILAGLFFLAIGVLGKIGAKIEPGTAGRVLSGLPGAVLVLGGLIWHSATDQNLQAAAAHSPIQPTFETSLVPTVGAASLLESCGCTAGLAAIALSPITMPADPKHSMTSIPIAKALGEEALRHQSSAQSRRLRM
jgi:hypothetical protein